MKVPAQLIGIIDDARGASIDTFTLEYSRGLVMASFSGGNHAAEIDFELEAGEEMLRFLRSGAVHPKARQWEMRCTYDSETFDLIVRQTGNSRKGPLRVKWSVSSSETGT